MNQDNATSVSLLERVREQDAQAWQRLVQLYGPLVHFWCQRWGVPAEDAEDVVQEVFLAVSRGLSDFERQRCGSFRSWMRGICRHKFLDHQRRRQRQPDAAEGGTVAQVRIQELAEADPAEEATEVSGLYRRALELLRTHFEENTWRAFWGVAVDGRPTDVVAGELGMSAVAVRIAKSRVLARLREEMQELID
jgi:RNA polymerase sigma-70 factor (ECF subfamily)